MATIKDLQAATIAARERTSDQRISTNVKAGRFQPVIVEKRANGCTDVTPMAGRMSFSDVVAFLNGL